MFSHKLSRNLTISHSFSQNPAGSPVIYGNLTLPYRFLYNLAVSLVISRFLTKYRDFSPNHSIPYFLQFEWEQFLKKIDTALNGDVVMSKPSVGDPITLELTLTDVRTNADVRVTDLVPRNHQVLLVLLRHFA